MSKENAKVLDIGFGTGTLTTKLYENGCEVYGQDFSQRMIELAKENEASCVLMKKLGFQVKEETSFKKYHMDITYDSYVFEYII